MSWSTRAASAPRRVSRRVREAVRGEIVRGHADFIAGRDYWRQLAREPLLRRSVPSLIILFIVAAAAVRIATLASEHEAIDARAHTNVSLLAGEAAADLGSLDTLPATIGDGGGFDDVVSTLLPASAVAEGRMMILADPNGRVVSVAPSQPSFLGLPLNRVLGEFPPFDGKAGAITLTTPGIGEAIVAVRQVARPPVGLVVLAQSKASVFAEWDETVVAEAAFFAAMSSVLILLGFAYQSQAARAAKADAFQSESEARIHIALKRGRSGLWAWSLDQGTIFWSASLAELVGGCAEARHMTTAEFDDHIHPQDRGVFETFLAGCPEDGSTLDGEFRFRNLDGGYLWVRAVGEVGRDGTGARRMTGIMSDVTEKRKLAERTRMADARLREAIETISEAFVLWDSRNRLVICNDKYRELYGLDGQVLQPGTPYEDVRAASRRTIIASRMATHPEFPFGRSLESELEDGRWLQINERRTRDGGFVSVGTDITAIKRHEHQLMQSERVLTATVEDLTRSRALLEEQTRRLQSQTDLLQAQRVELELHAQQLVVLADNVRSEKEKAEDASRAKSTFLAKVSHELRTPLNAIIGFSEMMQSGVFGGLGHARYGEYCRDIHESGKFLLEIITDILEMAHLDAGRVQVRPQMFGVQAVIAETTRIFAEKAQLGNLNVDTFVEGGQDVFADPRAFRQILYNLVSNAVKFTPRGGCVNIACETKAHATLLSVADTGIGIPAHAIERLGRPFEQVENEMTRSRGGSGLGLAITRSLVELHGGVMTIQSAVGEGTTVTIALPRNAMPVMMEAGAASLVDERDGARVLH